MNNFEMSKSEVVVLFDLIGAESIPVGIADFPNVSEKQNIQIVESFVDSKLLDISNNLIRPDKGLERFLSPILKSDNIVIFNYGRNNKCKFNATLFNSKSGNVAVLEETINTVRFIRFDSFADFNLFIQRFELISPNGEENQFISFIIFEKGFSIVHWAKLDSKARRVSVVEAKKYSAGKVDEKNFSVDVEEYDELFEGKLRETYDAVSY